MNITLRQLLTFLTVQKFGSLVQAAQELNLTQSALSHQLKELERHLGFKLFHRTTRRITLTMEGEVFLPYATRIRQSMESATECAAALSRGARGIVRICTTEVLASTHVMSVVASFQERNPDIEVQIIETLPDKVTEYLEDERAHIALGPERPVLPGMVSEIIFQVPLVALCSRAHPLAGKETVAWEDLKDEQLLFAAGGARLAIDSDINGKVDFKKASEVTHFTTLLAQASIGKHVAITTQYVERFLPIYGLNAIPLIKPRTLRNVVLYTPERITPSHATSLFIEHLKASLQTDDYAEIDGSHQ